jgi:hypothetical protein
MTSQTPVTLRPPSKYASAAAATPAPTPAWLHRTWAVTHSTLKMWRSAQNVRITYAPLAPKADGSLRVDDLVEYESNKPGKAGVSTVRGVDTSAGPAPREGEGATAWDWRGRGWLFFVSSHWEVLGWGETAAGEAWAVTWFAPTVFSQEGVDLYSSRKEGMSEELYQEVRKLLEGLDGVGPMVKNGLQAVDIKLPWQEK